MTSNPFETTSKSPQGDTFLTAILEQLWDRINAAASQAVKEQVEPALKEQLPAPLNTLHFTKLDLGKVPLRFDNIIVHEKREGVVQFDIDIAWNGESEIELQGDYVGKVGVKTIKFYGRITIILKPLLNVLPVAGAVQFYFIDPPFLEIDFTGVAELADSLLLGSTVKSIIASTIASMLVPPNRMVAKLDPTVSLFDIYQPPLGVARIHVVQGEGFKALKSIILPEDTPDVYCIVTLGKSTVLRTTCVANSVDPKWDNQFGDILLFDNRQTLSIQVWDDDTLAQDKLLGTATFTFQKVLQEANGTLKLDLDDKAGAKCTGSSITVRCELLPLTTTTTDSLSTQMASSNVIGGVLTIIVTQASGIPPKTSTFVKATFGLHVFKTPTVVPLEPPAKGDTKTPPLPPGYDSSKPSYDSVFHIPITTAESAWVSEIGAPNVVLQLSSPSDVLGEVSIPYADLASATDKTITEKREFENGASFEFRVSLHGLQLTGSA